MKTRAFIVLVCLTATIPLVAAPAAPTNVAATDGTHAAKVAITWKAVTGASSYEVWRATSSSSTSAARITTRTTLSYDDTSAAAGTTYYYWIKARNSTGTSNLSSSDSGYRISIVFQEHGSSYGYDQYTDATHPWKSVEAGKSDSVRAVITPSAPYKVVSFASASSSQVSVSPSTPSSASQVLSNQGGTSRGTARINVRAHGNDLGYYSGAVYRKIQRTVAVTLVHEQDTDGKGANQGYSSVDISDSLIISDLQRVYKQAVIEWTVVRRAACTVNFDLNNDGKIDVNTWMSAEMQKIRDICGSSHQYNIFLVSKPSDGSSGFMQANQKYGFVHVENGNAKTVGHELGHGSGGLSHTPSDSENIMYNYSSSTKWRLRKGQWDRLNP
ncbi:MAG TPA: fibronectin type III domain-containing protein [Thermoanaerobaculia bacterium]|jgi:hypothetical protein